MIIIWEGAIAVKNLNGNTNSLGNTDAVYQNTTKFDLVIKKKTSGSAGKILHLNSEYTLKIIVDIK